MGTSGADADILADTELPTIPDQTYNLKHKLLGILKDGLQISVNKPHGKLRR